MGLEIVQEQQGIARILTLRGRLDTETSADLELGVQDLLGAGERNFLIDLGGVSYVSSAGLRVLLALAKQLDQGRGSLRLCALNPSVTQVFEVAGFSKLFVIFKDQAAALASMSIAPAARGPSLADHVSRLLGARLAPPAVNAKAAELAQATAQLLGVRPGFAQAAAASAIAAGNSPAAVVVPVKKAPGFFAKLFGKS
jgi:anti-anti-sigma factor